MRWIVEYIKSLFCKHDMTVEEIIIKHSINGWGRERKDYPKVGMYCKKCGYHKSFWKF